MVRFNQLTEFVVRLALCGRPRSAQCRARSTYSHGAGSIGFAEGGHAGITLRQLFVAASAVLVTLSCDSAPQSEAGSASKAACSAASYLPRLDPKPDEGGKPEDLLGMLLSPFHVEVKATKAAVDNSSSAWILRGSFQADRGVIDQIIERGKLRDVTRSVQIKDGESFYNGPGEPDCGYAYSLWVKQGRTEGEVEYWESKLAHP